MAMLFVCLCVVLCLPVCGSFVMYDVMLYGLFLCFFLCELVWCWFVVVFVCFVCDCLRDVVWYV